MTQLELNRRFLPKLRVFTKYVICEYVKRVRLDMRILKWVRAEVIAKFVRKHSDRIALVLPYLRLET